MKPIKHLLLTTVICILAFGANANNLQITGLTVSQGSSTGGNVTFTITWNNCWNLSTTAAPNNWDAAWVFVKFRNCSASPAIPFTHGTINTVMSNNTLPSSLQAMTSLPQSSYYSSNGSVPVTTTLDDANGIMLSPVTAGTASSVTGTVTLNITNLPSNANTITVEVIGIEMVYVPQGPFYLGDGSTNASYWHFCTSASSSAPALINAANETAVSSYYYMSGGINTPTAYVASVPAAFPKGYYAFYCMKYEITEDLYTQFLNTIGSAAAATRWIGNSGSNRNNASQTNSYTFANSRPYRVQNWLSWADWEAVLAWSCLRPMTELEYEKACRGGSSTTANGAENNEFPWQNTSVTPGTTFSGAENGTETFTNANANCVCYGPNNFSNGDGGQGPARSGIFATASSTQQTAGATYYGIMEMAGNVREFVVQLGSTVAIDSFTRSFNNYAGSGNLVASAGLNGDQIGDAAVQYWPNPEAGLPTGNTIGSFAFGQRGGDWYAGPNSAYTNYGYPNNDPLQTSSRMNCYYFQSSGYYQQNYYMGYWGAGRGAVNGGRGVR